MSYRFPCVVAGAVLFLSVFPPIGYSAEGDAEVVNENGRIPYGKMIPEYVDVVYSGSEDLSYTISWTGGVKLGELHISIGPAVDAPGSFDLSSVVSTEGYFMDSIYPVHDQHRTRVRGEDRLPYLYEVHQREGRKYKAYRLTTYDQDKGVITYQKNENPVVEYHVEGKVYNEFSAFFASRLMNFAKGESFLVPTFADKRQVDVQVRTLDFTTLEGTVLGDVRVAEVTPILKFKGLYDKRGDTVIWYTDDACRVPVLINSKIAIGSITATLISYNNPACEQYRASGEESVQLTETEPKVQKKE